ncbi:MAG: hypothetical protein ACI9KE_006618 [Polyangiales bacterium]|jgi:hypothetical protein
MRIFLSLLLSLTVVACGDDDTLPATDAGPTSDAGPVVTTDAGPVTTDAGPVTTDAGPVTTDAGPAPVITAQTLIDAQNSITVASCACSFADSGYNSAEECAAVSSVAEPFEACYGTGFEAIDAANLSALGCYYSVQAEAASCFLAAGCDDQDAIDVCSEAAEIAAADCDEDAFRAGFEQLSASAIMCATTDAMTCPDGEGSSALGMSVFMGTTIGGANNYDDEGECNFSTPERTHTWTAPSAGTFTFDTVGSRFDTNLALFADCDATESIECNDDGVEETLFSSITRTFEDGESVLVVIEGYDGGAGDYMINVTEEAEVPAE